MNQNKKIDQEAWLKDFQDFCEADEERPHPALTQSVSSFVHRELNPSMWNVLGEFALIQALIGSLSLFVCAQFGLGNGPLALVFARLGDTLCMALCGALFLGLGALATSVYLKKPELDLVRKAGYLPILAIAVLSLGILFGFGAEIVFGLGIAWLMGAFVGGLVALEAGALLRARA